jgi:hypothetical protein
MSFNLIPQAQAQCLPGNLYGGINLGDCLKLSDSTAVSAVYDSPAFLVNLIVRNLFIVAGVIFFLMIIFAGYRMILGGQKGAEDAKNIFNNAIIGFIIMFSAYWIVQIISYMTGVSIIG